MKENFPGIQIVREDIFKLLDKESVLKCRMVNSSWKRFFDPPIFWLLEDIFKLLDKNSLMKCRMVSTSWKQILDQPLFWLKNVNFKKTRSQSFTSLMADLCQDINKVFFI